MENKRTPESEEYLELLARYEEGGKEPKVKLISRGLGVSPASVSEMLKKLSGKGLVEYERYGKIRLTKKGMAAGRKVLRKHRLIEDFLAWAGVKKACAHREACALEHVVSDEVEEALKKAMGTQKGKAGQGNKIKRLVELKKGEEGRIVIICGGRSSCRRLTDMGLTPGAKISVSRASGRMGPLEIRVRSSHLAIGRGIAEKILVRVG